MLTRWSDVDRMFRKMNLLRNGLDGIISDFDTPALLAGNWNIDQNTPRTNLYDRGGKFEIIAEVAGFAKEDLSIKIQGNYLELSGSRKTDAPEGYSTHRTERKSISFTRSFTLPSEVNSEGAEANLQDGLLRLVLPKSAAATPRQITIA